MSESVLLVVLSEGQIKLAKQVNDERRQITHAVVCGKYGQFFGTEKQCRKYFWAWKQIFPYLFVGGIEVDHFEINDYESVPDLVTVLIEANDRLRKAARNLMPK